MTKVEQAVAEMNAVLGLNIREVGSESSRALPHQIVTSPEDFLVLIGWESEGQTR